MNGELNLPGPSRPKRVCTFLNAEYYDITMHFDSKFDENCDFSYSGSEYMLEDSFQPVKDLEIS